MSFDFKSLSFPRNVGTDEVPNYVRFVPKIIKYGGTKSLRQGTNAIQAPTLGGSASSIRPGSVFTGLGGVQGNLLAAVDNIQAFGDGLNSTIGNITSAVQNASNQFSNSPGSFTDLVKAGGTVINKVFDIKVDDILQGMLVGKDTLNSVGSINLYLPQNLETNSSVDYETAALGGVGAAATEASRAENLDMSAIAGQLIPGAIQDLLSSGNRRAVLGIATNRVTNNFSFQVFNSVLHRQFAYEFRMMAKDENESKTIKEICDMFLFFMLPARTTEGNIGLYEVPCQWEIQYLRKGGPLNFHMQPKNCFLQSVDVSYGGDAGNSTYNDGAPMDVTIRLQFIEIEPLYRDGDPLTPRPLTNTEKALDVLGGAESADAKRAMLDDSVDG